MERDKAHYIAWKSGLTGTRVGPFGVDSVNTDDRLWNQADGPFLLSVFSHGDTVNYAVTDADAEEFIGRVLRQSEADGGRDGKNAGIGGAEVRIGMELHPFRDADLLKAWLEELRLKCGEPLSAAALYRYTHPAPISPEGAVEVTKIVEQAVLPPRSPAVLGPGPDNCRSELLVEEDAAFLSVFRNGMHLEYLLPPELLPEVNAAAREMLDHPGDGYHAAWDADAWIRVKGREEEFDAEPEDVLKLFERLADRCGDPIPRYTRMDFYKISPREIRDRLAGAWTCPLCGGKGNTGAYCETCGARREDIPAGRAVSRPGPRAAGPWSCRSCGMEGGVGGYCGGCGRPRDPSERLPDGPIGYRKGTGGGMPGMAGMFFGSLPLAQTPPPAPPKQAAPGEWFCPMCGARNSGKFCTECGKPKEDR